MEFVTKYFTQEEAKLFGLDEEGWYKFNPEAFERVPQPKETSNVDGADPKDIIIYDVKL